MSEALPQLNDAVLYEVSDQIATITLNRPTQGNSINNEMIEGVPMQVVSQRIFDAIVAYASGEKTRSEVLGYGQDEFLPWSIGAVM